jgi:hypothetical protein
MNRAIKTAAVTLVAALAAACSSTEYIISTNDGSMITTSGKPKLDEDSGMYTYKDTEGRSASIKKEQVKQIMER